MVGKVLAQYQISEKLGEGGMGVVWKARDTHLDRFVGLKTLSAERLVDPERKRRFVQEAKAASALNHPNIVHIYDIAETDGVQFIAMEYVAGKTLDQLIGRKGLRLNEVLKYAVQIADALAKAHSAGIIHRDLKPSNIMVNENDLVKVLDFGLAKLAETATGEFGETATVRTPEDPSTEEGTIVGTTAYMSPEQAEGKKVDARSDIFSFGSVLYEMVTGRRAFYGDSKLSTLSSILKDEPKPVSRITPDVPRDLEKIISRCLRKDPGRRFQHMDDLQVALLDLKEESESGRTDVPAALVSKTRRRSWIAVAGFAIVLLALSAAWRIWHTKTSEPASEMTAIPLTAYPGDERDPTFSPDGNQVAFSWNADQGASRSIYLKLVGPGNPIRLTNKRDVDDRMPRWSPDGKWLAFWRTVLGSSDTFVIVAPALGGAEKILPGPTNAAVSWTPDSRWLVYGADQLGGVALVSLATGEHRRVLEESWVYSVFSPDGRKLALAGGTAVPAGLLVVDIGTEFKPAGKPRLVTPRDWDINSPVWTPDSKEIVFIKTTGDANAGGSTSIWRAPANGSGPPSRIVAAGDNPWFLDVSMQGNRLAYTKLQRDVNLYRLQIDADGMIRNPGAMIASSSQIEQQPYFSPDGKRFSFFSTRGGTEEIWIADSDGSNAVPWSPSNGAKVSSGSSWSPDGRSMAYCVAQQNHISVFVSPAAGGSVRQLAGDSTGWLPTWSRDGKMVYYSAERSGRFEIMKVAREGGAAKQVTHQGGNLALESTDGKWLYYSKWVGNLTLWRMPVSGGEESQIAEIEAFDVTARGVFFFRSVPGGADTDICLLPAAGGPAKVIGTIRRPVYGSFSISPDSRSILFAQFDQSSADLMMIENFR